MLYEGGVRVPYIFRWTGRVEPGTASDQPINSVDLYPTLLDLAGAKPEAGYPLDGTRYLSLLTGGSTSQPRPPLFWHFPGYLGGGAGTWRTTPAGSIRDGDWKLLEFFETGKRELYNLRNDLGEKKDLASAMPEKLRELHAKLQAWRKDISAPMPRKRTAEEIKAQPGDPPAKSRKAARERRGE
jgi:arylsulfatase A-like enzyme